MPTHSQKMVDTVPTKYKKGSPSTKTLQGVFPESPIYLGNITDQNLTDRYQDIVMDAEINDGGHTFGTFNTGYVDAPDLNEVETGAGGLPATPYVPNPTSPGEGSVNASDQGPAPEDYGKSPNVQYGSGVGHRLQPKTSSTKIAGQKLGDYIMGSAYSE